MTTQKERKIVFMLLVAVLAFMLILSTTTLILISHAEQQQMQKDITDAINPTVIEETDPTEETQMVTELTACPDVYEEFLDRCRLNHAECRGEDFEGQTAVMATIINREESPDYPNDFYEVINQSGQFTPVRGGEIFISDNVVKYEDVSSETIDAVRNALNGADPTEQLLWDEAVRLGLDPVKYAEGGALYFYNPNYCNWQQLAARENIKVKVQIGNHIFYKVWDT